MAPSAGHLHKLVVRNYRLLKSALKKTTHLVQSRLPTSLRPIQSQLEPIAVRSGARHPIHPIALLRQSKARWHSTHSTVRTFATGSKSGVKYDRASFPKSRTANFVNNSTGRAPFASTLRPNLTGGALGRTAGGYALGSGRIGGARYFSHGPAAPAEVIQNVSQAVRAFWVSGQKAQFAGVNPANGEKRYNAVSTLHEETSRKLATLPKATPGSYIDFKVNPTITALTPLAAVAGFPTNNSVEYAQTHLNTEGLIDALSADFSRALKDLAVVLNDIKSLSTLGDLPLSYHSSSILRVNFPGCDAESVERLCDELGIKRGIVFQDDDFDAFVGTEIALLFPFAPSKTASETDQTADRLWGNRPPERLKWQDMLSSHSDDFSTRSELDGDLYDYDDFPLFTDMEGNPWLSSRSLSSPEGYGSLPPSEAHEASSPLEYQDFEGLYRFIELCDDARR